MTKLPEVADRLQGDEENLLVDVLKICADAAKTMTTLEVYNQLFALQPGLAVGWKFYMEEEGILETIWEPLNNACINDEDQDSLDALIASDELDEPGLNFLLQNAFLEGEVAKKVIEGRSVDSVKLPQNLEALRKLIEEYKVADADRQSVISELFDEFSDAEIEDLKKTGVSVDDCRRLQKARERKKAFAARRAMAAAAATQNSAVSQEATDANVAVAVVQQVTTPAPAVVANVAQQPTVPQVPVQTSAVTIPAPGAVTPKKLAADELAAFFAPQSINVLGVAPVPQRVNVLPQTGVVVNSGKTEVTHIRVPGQDESPDQAEAEVQNLSVEERAAAYRSNVGRSPELMLIRVVSNDESTEPAKAEVQSLSIEERAAAYRATLESRALDYRRKLQQS